MPVHPRDRKENNHEEMDVDYPEQEASTSDEEESVSSSVSEDGDTSGNVTDRDLWETPESFRATIKRMVNFLQTWMMKTVKEGEWSV